MATTRLMPLHVGKGRTAGTAIAAIIDYVENPEKTDNGKLSTSWQAGLPTVNFFFPSSSTSEIPVGYEARMM